MFAKSKRIQDGNEYLSIPKDATPGPGEDSLTDDESGKPKRFSFLSQALRFTENAVDSPPESLVGSDSSSSSLVSDSMSNTIEDARARRQVAEMAAQFEKYRQAMQKDFESLQVKHRKLEAALQSATADKDNARATLLSKDEELADLKQKNSALQKTVTLLEKNVDKSPKVIQLQKRISQLESERSAVGVDTDLTQQVAMLKSDVSMRDEIIAALQEKIQRHADIVERMDARLEEQTMATQRLHKENQDTLELMSTKLQATTEKLAENEHLIFVKSTEVDNLNRQLSELQQDCEDMAGQKTHLKRQIQHMEVQHQAEMEATRHEKEALQRESEQLQSALQTSSEALEAHELRWQERQGEIDVLQRQMQQVLAERDRQQAICQKLQKQFQLYRTQTAHLVGELRRRLKAANDTSYSNQAERLAAELLESKKFINQQGLELDGLKSELHWMSKWNTCMWDVVQAVQMDRESQRDIMTMYAPFFGQPAYYTPTTHHTHKARSSVDSGFESRLSLESDVLAR